MLFLFFNIYFFCPVSQRDWQVQTHFCESIASSLLPYLEDPTDLQKTMAEEQKVCILAGCEVLSSWFIWPDPDKQMVWRQLCIFVIPSRFIS